MLVKLKVSFSVKGARAPLKSRDADPDPNTDHVGSTQIWSDPDPLKMAWDPDPDN